MSNLSSVGFGVSDAVELSELLGRLGPSAVSLGRQGRTEALRIEDPSGARLTLSVRHGRRRSELEDAMPSFASSSRIKLGSVSRMNPELHRVAIDDPDGLPFVLALEQRDLLPREPVRGIAAVSALASEVEWFEDESAFHASRRSQIDPDDTETGTVSPAEGPSIERPLRMAAESLLAYDLFGSPKDAEGYARINGIVLEVERRRNAATGQEFSVVRVRTVGMEIDFCLDATVYPSVPSAGSVIGGVVYVVGSLDEWELEPPSPSSGPRRLLRRALRRS